MRRPLSMLPALAAVAITAAVGYEFVAGARPVSPPGPDGWMRDFESALATASREHKAVFVDFYSDTCPPCKELERTTFPDPSVRRALAGFVPVRVGLDESTESIFRKYQIDLTPSLLVLDAQGAVVRQSVGYKTPSELVEFLEKKS